MIHPVYLYDQSWSAHVFCYLGSGPLGHIDTLQWYLCFSLITREGRIQKTDKGEPCSRISLRSFSRSWRSTRPATRRQDPMQIGLNNSWKKKVKTGKQKMCQGGRGGCQVVSVLAFYSDDPSSNPRWGLQFFCKIVIEKIKNKQKRGRGWPIF